MRIRRATSVHNQLVQATSLSHWRICKSALDARTELVGFGTADLEDDREEKSSRGPIDESNRNALQSCRGYWARPTPVDRQPRWTGHAERRRGIPTACGHGRRDTG